MATSRIPFAADTIFHIVQHANGFENLFNEDKNYAYFLGKYKEYINPIADTYAYCLMPNHVHIVLKIKELDVLKDAFLSKKGIRKYKKKKEVNNVVEILDEIKDDDIPNLISKQFGHFFNAYAKAFNKEYARKGSLFIESVFRESIDDLDYFQYCVRYVHNNPVKHGFVDNIFDWQHSSIHAYRSSLNSLLCREQVFEWFDGVDNFWRFHGKNDTPSNLDFLEM